jgi:hypothetical protein
MDFIVRFCDIRFSGNILLGQSGFFALSVTCRSLSGFWFEQSQVVLPGRPALVPYQGPGKLATIATFEKLPEFVKLLAELGL